MGQIGLEDLTYVAVNVISSLINFKNSLTLKPIIRYTFTTICQQSLTISNQGWKSNNSTRTHRRGVLVCAYIKL